MPNQTSSDSFNHLDPPPKVSPSHPQAPPRVSPSQAPPPPGLHPAAAPPPPVAPPPKPNGRPAAPPIAAPVLNEQHVKTNAPQTPAWGNSLGDERRNLPVTGHKRRTFVVPAWLRPFLNRLSSQETPSWLTSLIVHLVLIISLALIPIANHIGIGDSISFISGPPGESDGADTLTSMVIDSGEESIAKLETMSEAMNTSAVSLDLQAPSLAATPPSDGLPSNFSLDSPILGGLKGRSGVLKDALLKAYGGSQGTEDAVALGLQWLAKQQTSDGSWSIVGPYKGGAVKENKPAATAMAMLAFIGAGNTHQSGEYKTQVQRGLKYLTKIQDEDGFFAKEVRPPERTYSQAQCSIVVCELFGMTGDTSLESVAMRAVKYAQFAQGANGGWRYQPKEPGDMSVTGWYVMALMSARMGGLYVESNTLERVHEFLDLVQRSGFSNTQDPKGERYVYQKISGGNLSLPMTAEGILCRLYLGWNASDNRVQAGCDLLCESPISSPPEKRNYYYWYYATTTLHHVGGEHWRTWNKHMSTELPALQEKSGPNAGSWSAKDDPHEGSGGRLYATCFSILCLETYYRHLPLNRMTGE